MVSHVSYAIVWSEDSGPVYAGRLELCEGFVLLAGSARQARERTRNLSYDELARVWVERRPEGRLSGRPTLVVERLNGARVRVACLEGAGVLHELAEQLATAREQPAA